jgi:hypothetical protein
MNRKQLCLKFSALKGGLWVRDCANTGDAAAA